MLFFMACTGGSGAELAPEGVDARDRLAASLVERDPSQVGPIAEQASAWEGQDPPLDRLLGDALANVLMNADDGLQLLRKHPDLGNSQWEEATRSAALRTGNVETIRAVWAELGEAPIPFDNPVLSQIVQRMRAEPKQGSLKAIEGLFGCQLLDAQPAVGRKSMDHPIGPEIVDVAAALGVEQVTIGRPVYRSDPDPQSGRGHLQCQRKILLSDGWPRLITKTITIGLRQGDRTAFIDIKMVDGEPWAYATSNELVGDRLLRAWMAQVSDRGQDLSERYPNGVWASEPEAGP